MSGLFPKFDALPRGAEMLSSRMWVEVAGLFGRLRPRPRLDPARAVLIERDIDIVANERGRALTQRDRQILVRELADAGIAPGPVLRARMVALLMARSRERAS